MPKFFLENKIKIGDIIKLNNNDIYHIKFVLRKKIGQYLNVCDGNNNDYICLIYNNETLKVINHTKCLSEMKIKLNIFIAVSKNHKAEDTIRQCVEIGVNSIIIFKSSRCISKITDVKIQRYNKIIYSAAKQSNRGIIPKIFYIDDFNKALNYAKQSNEKLILANEKSENKLKTILKKYYKSIAAFIGPEGGFSDKEIDIAQKYCNIVSLCNRILRCETAPVFLSSIIAYYYE